MDMLAYSFPSDTGSRGEAFHTFLYFNPKLVLIVCQYVFIVIAV